jgi:glycosyltransferase involved in cell wall biosynthesis
VGIQHPRKGHDVLLKALALIREFDWHAVIVGSRYDPDHAADLDRLHARFGLGARVRMAGRVPDAALRDLYRGAAVFALATRYEGYGIVFNEALVHGLPIVSCRTGAVPDTVPAQAGLLVPPDDPEAFAEALSRLLSEKGLRAQLAQAAARAGALLPDWRETAGIAGAVLDNLSGLRAARADAGG